MQSLRDHLLVAMPTMGDPNFAETVTFICDHDDRGALGVIINRPLSIQAREIFDQLSLSVDSDQLAAQPVLGGGPVHQDRGFVLHRVGSYETTLETPRGIKVTMSQDILQAMAAGSGPDEALIALGCAGWDAGQLETELAANAWLSVPAQPDILFDTPFEQRWTASAKLLGIDITSLSIYAGHA